MRYAVLYVTARMFKNGCSSYVARVTARAVRAALADYCAND